MSSSPLPPFVFLPERQRKTHRIILADGGHGGPREPVALRLPRVADRHEAPGQERRHAGEGGEGRGGEGLTRGAECGRVGLSGRRQSGEKRGSVSARRRESEGGEAKKKQKKF